MRKTAITMSMAAMLAFGVSYCSSSSDSGSSTSGSTYLAQNLPSKFAVNSPDSLKKKSTTAAKISADEQPGGPGGGAEQQSLAYDELQGLITQKDQKEKSIKMEFMMIDALIEKVKGQASPVFGAAGSQTITFTAEMRKAIEELIPADQLSSPEALAGVPAAGTEMPGPAFCYRSGFSENGYNFEIKFAFDEADSAAVTDCSSTKFTSLFQWNEAKTLLRITDEFKMEIPGGGGSFSGNSLFNFDAAKNLMTFKNTFKDQMGEFSQVVAMAPCSTDAAKTAVDCVKFDAKYGLKMTIEGQTQEFTFAMSGIADDNGGVVNTTLTMKMPPQPQQKITYDEVFTKEGKVTASRTNGGAWSGEDGSSSSYFTEAQNVDVGQKKLTITWNADSPGTDTSFQFVLVKNGGSAANPEDIIGEGAAINVGGTVTTEVYYFGPEDATVITTAKVFSLDGFNQTTGEPTFTAKAAATVAEG